MIQRKLLQRTNPTSNSFMNKIRMLQRTVFINKIRMLQRTVLQRTVLSIKSGCYNEQFINKIRMLQRTNATTNECYNEQFYQ